MLDIMNYHLSTSVQETTSEDQAVWSNRVRQIEDEQPEREFLENTVAQKNQCYHDDKEENETLKILKFCIF